MLYPEKVRRALETRLPELLQWDARHAEEMESYRQGLGRLEEMDAAEITSLVEGKDNPGALPSEEHGSPLIVPFGRSWSNHEDARRWAFDRIQEITTLAVDGSQIPPSKDYSLGIGAIQVAWFENHHCCDGRGYVKDARFELLSPRAQREAGEEGSQLIQEVNLRRFESEVEVIMDHMHRWERQSDRPPVAFFDGTLVASFAAPLSAEPRTRYVRAILNMLETSEKRQVPLVGFVDTSHARDLCTLLAHLAGQRRPERINDGYLLQGRLRWGDRTRAFVCARDHILSMYRYDEEGPDYQRELAFFYLQTTGDGPPARVDIPRWVVREGLVDYVADVVRCEVIAGTGYPYCFEAVDAAAVLSVIDREAFYQQVQAFCERNGMRLRLAPKAASKRRRRL